MPTVRTRYVTWNRGGGRRLHTGPAAATDIIAPLQTTVSPGGSYGVWAPPTVDLPGPPGLTGTFAFWSITDSATGSWVSTDPQIAVEVGDSDVNATAWYLPAGGPGMPQGPALLIDAFDVNAGWWADDDFVTVVSDPSLTFDANEHGVVPLEKDQDVHAYSAIHGVPFDEWTVITDNEAVNGQDLHGAADTKAIAFAFYKSPVRAKFGTVRVPAQGTWVSWGVMVDGGGPTGDGPVGPWGPKVMKEIAAGMALAEAAQYIDVDLREAVLDIAAKQVEIGAGHLAKQLTEKVH